ncbi:MAG: hypothetical protein CMB80_03295 [Flammeovirgaceae bacterium]|nr:hypothetical protein [Flammeovirgaceae bacterium]|tara:strand:+ start:45 stop:242 length:198 start_codon:yes stop_codon:yes gene_type:complete
MKVGDLVKTRDGDIDFLVGIIIAIAGEKWKPSILAYEMVYTVLWTGSDGEYWEYQNDVEVINESR